MSTKVPNTSVQVVLPSTKTTLKNKSGKSHTSITAIEKIVGFVDEQYECVYNNFAGTLYAGPLAAVWLGRIFFFEWTVVIQWDAVMQVQQRSDGVTFIVSAPKSSTYDFINLFNAEKAWASLVSLHNDSIIGKTKREPTPRQFTRSLRRMSSDPSRMTCVFPSGMGEDDDDALNRGSALKKKGDGQLLVRSSSVPIEQGMEIGKECERQESLETDFASMSQKSNKPSLEQQWASVVNDSISYGEKAVARQELPCSLESFFELFVGDDAMYSVPIFMKEIGDEEIQCSPWITDKEGVTKSRTIEYTHPINAPMAPPMARARKEQCYQKFGGNGIVIETKTYVADVPMTDCFYVADQILVETVDDNKVAVTMSFGLEFVKSTMFKAIIVRTTKGEFQNFMQQLTNFMSGSLGQRASAPSIVPAVPTPAPESVPGPGLWPKLAAGLLVLILLLQIWIILDIRTMKSTLQHLHSKSAQCPDSWGFGGLA